MGALAIGLASSAQGLTGFGFSVVAVPLLLTVFQPQTAVVLSLVLSLVLTASLLRSAPGEVDLRSRWPLFASSVVGAVGGALLLPHLDGPWLRPAMGFAAFAGGLVVVFGKSLRPFRREGAAMAGAGFVSGLMNGVASLSGPAVGALALVQRWPAARARKTLLAYSLFVNVAALIPLTLTHVVTGGRLALAAPLVPLVFAGRLIGKHGSRLLPAAGYRLAAVALILGAGIVAVGQGIAAAAH